MASAKCHLDLNDMTEVLCDEYGVSIGEAAKLARSDMDVIDHIGFYKSIRTKSDYKEYLNWLEDAADEVE